VVAWVRQAKNRVAQFAQMDQSYVLAVSLKDLAKGQWGPNRGEWTFDVPEELFKGQAHVRLQGLGLAVVNAPEALPIQAKSKSGQKADADPGAPKPLGFWSASVSLPAMATVRNLSGATSELDQKALPSCYFGMVGDREASRDPEIGGGNAIRNVSPIGKGWKVVLSPKSTDGALTADLQDVQLYLHVAVRTLKAGA
jgi:hypothetical protein